MKLGRPLVCSPEARARQRKRKTKKKKKEAKKKRKEEEKKRETEKKKESKETTVRGGDQERRPRSVVGANHGTHSPTSDRGPAEVSL